MSSYPASGGVGGLPPAPPADCDNPTPTPPAGMATYDCATDTLVVTFPDDVTGGTDLRFHGPGSVDPPVAVEGSGISYVDPGVSVVGNTITVTDFFTQYIGVPGAAVQFTGFDAEGMDSNVISSVTQDLLMEEC